MPSVNLIYHNGSFVPVSVSDQVVLEACYGHLPLSSHTLDSVDIPPLTHCLHNEFPSANYIHDLQRSLADHSLTLPVEAHLNFSSLLYHLYHLYLQISHLHPTTAITSDPGCLQTIVCHIHNETMGCLNQTFHQLGMGDFLLDLQQCMQELAEVQQEPHHTPHTLTTPSACTL